MNSIGSARVVFTTGKFLKGTTIENFKNNASAIYDSAHLMKAGLDSSVFLKALTGFYNLRASSNLSENAAILTIIDFNKSSTFKRMWIVDIKAKLLLLQTWVAHGEGSGMDFAGSFSNEASSYQSSLGFYLTDAVYAGKHGRSLKLIGLDQGFNDRAYERKIVVHAAKYVSQRFIEKNGHLGRSQGCPAVSPAVVGHVIGLLKGNTVVFINGNDPRYNSKFLDLETAAMIASNEIPNENSVSFNTSSGAN